MPRLNGYRARLGARPLTALLGLLGLLPVINAAHAATFEIEWQGTSLSISGDASSTGHVETLRGVAADLFPEARRQIDLDVSAAPPGWSLLTEQALRAIAQTRAGQASIDSDSVVLRGEYGSAANWRNAISRVSAALLPGMRLQDQALAVDTRRGLSDYCLRQLTAATHERRVDFRLNSAELRPSAYPLLDALVEIAADCPAAQILVIGHTDASGSEEFNTYLSQRRAQAVVAYMTRRGISAERLSAHGAGASEPLGDNATRAGRARNRRIEFAMGFAK